MVIVPVFLFLDFRGKKAKIFSFLMFISFGGKRNEPKKNRHVADFYFASLNGGSAKLGIVAEDKSAEQQCLKQVTPLSPYSHRT